MIFSACAGSVNGQPLLLYVYCIEKRILKLSELWQYVQELNGFRQQYNVEKANQHLMTTDKKRKLNQEKLINCLFSVVRSKEKWPIHAQCLLIKR